MTSVLSVASPSRSSSSHYSMATPNHVSPSPPLIHSNLSAKSTSSSLSHYSLEGEDKENATITGNRLAGEMAPEKVLGKQKTQSQEDLRFLAISTHITELSYSISDIQTRIFEIQELRHKSQTQSTASDPSSPTINNVTSIIDQSLMSLDERLEVVEKGIKSVNENMAPYLPVPPTPTTATQASSSVTPTASNMNGSFSGHRPVNVGDGTVALLRKHAALISEWESVQDESDVLREELKEDKWLTVFRTVTDQADGMMSSLEKAVNRCQDFIFQVHQQKRNGLNNGDDLFGSTSASGGGPITLETFNSLLESYEAKKKHYMPATSKVLSIIDRGVRDRVTKNGETLRRHSESAQRWKNLRDRIVRTDAELENVRKILAAADAGESENGSSNTSRHPSTASRGGYLATPSGASRNTNGSERGSEKSGGTLSRSISPFRKFARRITGSTSGGKHNISNPTLVTPLAVNKKLKTPASEPPPAGPSNSSTLGQSVRKQRTSLFARGPGLDPATPDRLGHKYSQSATPESSPHLNLDDSTGANAKSYGGYATTSTLGKSRSSLASGTLPPSLASRPTWNSSTNVNGTSDAKRTPGGTVRPPRSSSRPPSATGMYSYFGNTSEVPPPVPAITPSTPYRRSLSRTSMSSTRPWSPQSSTTHSSNQHYGPVPPLSFSSTTSGSSSRFTPSRPPSRSQTPSGSSTAASLGVSGTPKQRPRTPPHVPSPAGRSASVGTKVDMFSSSNDWSPTNSRPFSPAMSASSAGGDRAYHPPRPPSRSMIPVPTVHVGGSGGRSRPSSSMSHLGYGFAGRAGAESPTMRMASGSNPVTPFKSNARRAQTPDMMRSVSAATGGANDSGFGTLSRPTINTQRLPPPSSFRDGSGSAVSNGSGSVYVTPNTRPSSRSGLYEGGPSLVNASTATLTGPAHEYAVGNSKDPLDVEVGRVVNAIPHGLTIERVDPPLKKIPKDGEEVKAQYAMSNALGKKVITCRLTTMTRATKVKTGGDEGTPEKETVAMVTTKKVMCRVGGGWQDLGLYIVNRQAGL